MTPESPSEYVNREIVVAEPIIVSNGHAAVKLRAPSGHVIEIDVPLNCFMQAQRVYEIPQPRQQPASAARFARCANCGDKLPLTGDAEQDHHTAQRHHIELCKRRALAEDDRTGLLEDWNIQLMRTAEENHKQLAAAQRPRLQPAATPRPWWKFW